MKSLMEVSVVKKRKADIEIMDIFDMEIDVANEAAKRKEMGHLEKYNFFDVMLDYCFFDNDDKAAQTLAGVYKSAPGVKLTDGSIRADPSLQFRSP